MLTQARGTTSKHVMALLLYIMIMTQLPTTSTTSVNKINYGISCQQLRASKIVVSEFIYDFILTLPSNNIIHRSETIMACNVDSANKSHTHMGYKSPHDNDTPHTINCSPAIQSLITTLHETDHDIHADQAPPSNQAINYRQRRSMYHAAQQPLRPTRYNLVGIV